MKFKKSKRLVHRKAAPQKSAYKRLRFESLEERRLLAAMPELLKDIIPGAASSHPGEFTQVNSVVFFSADDGSSGDELWKSDGTAAGTVRVKDIFPGTNSSSPSNLVNVNGTLFFAANDLTGGRELWKSDGTDSGTMRVKDIQPGAGFSNPSTLTNVGGTLFFVALNDSLDERLWRSDGTNAGTVQIANILVRNLGNQVPEFTTVNGTLFFSAFNATGGYELWKSDGTNTGTLRVKDINPGAADSAPIYITNVSGTLYFQANDGTSGRELWKSDGTEAGTVRVKNINPLSADSKPSQLVNVNGTLYFHANDGTNGTELWKSNGSTTGTVRVLDINPGVFSSDPDELANVNGTLFFNADDSTNGRELWRSNGTAAGTVRIKDIAPGNANSYPGELTDVNGKVYFTAIDINRNYQIWRSDGTTAGTVRVADFRSGDLTNINGTLYFRANDGVHGIELWVVRPEVATSLSISATSSNKNEGNAGTTSFTFTVTRSGTVTGATTVNYAVTGVGASPAAASDFVGSAFPIGSVTFAAGQTSRVITIPVRGDLSVEADERFVVTLSNPTGSATITTATAAGLIRNDDAATLAIAATSANKVEGNSSFTSFTFTITRTGATSGASTVNYAVTGSGAYPADANDFFGLVLPNGQVSFAAGETSKVLAIRVRGDSAIEADERFVVTLSSPIGATITTATSAGLIRNDDFALLDIAATSANKNEGNSGFTSFTFTVTRTGATEGSTTVNYAVAGNGANPAQATDFFGNVFSTGQVSFAAGETIKVISIRVRGDAITEANEGFRVTLSNASLGALITTAVASGLIRNDDV